MKNSGRKIAFVALFVIFAVIATVVFLTVPDKRIEQTVFWIAFAFAIPFNLVCALGLLLWTGRKDGEDIVDFPLAYFLIAVFGVIYLVVGGIFMYINVTKPLVLIIIEIVVTSAYLIATVYFTTVAKHITNTQKQTKKKVLFINLLVADVNDLAVKAENDALKTALSAFADNVKFSDPMSHPSLAGVEAELNSTVAKIGEKIAENSYCDALDLVEKAQILLKSRNERCLTLK